MDEGPDLFVGPLKALGLEFLPEPGDHHLSFLPPLFDKGSVGFDWRGSTAIMRGKSRHPQILAHRLPIQMQQMSAFRLRFPLSGECMDLPMHLCPARQREG
jgi:hypothetical protein